MMRLGRKQIVVTGAVLALGCLIGWYATTRYLHRPEKQRDTSVLAETIVQAPAGTPAGGAVPADKIFDSAGRRLTPEAAMRIKAHERAESVRTGTSPVGQPAPSPEPTAADQADIATAQALAGMGTPEAVIELVKLLNRTTNLQARGEIMLAAASLVNPQSADILYELMDSTVDPELASIARQALANMLDGERLHEIVDLYTVSQDETEQQNLVNLILQNRNPETIGALIELAENAAGDVVPLISMSAMSSLGMIGTPEAVDYLFSRLRQAGPQVDPNSPEAAAVALITNPEAMPVLLAMIQDSSPEITAPMKVYAAQALSNYDNPQVREALNTMSQSDPDLQIRAACAKALQRLQSLGQ